MKKNSKLIVGSSENWSRTIFSKNNEKKIV